MKRFSEFILEQSLKINMTSRDVSKHLRKHNWRLEDGGKLHDIWSHPTAPHKIAVPRHKGDLAPGTVRQILKASTVA